MEITIPYGSEQRTIRIPPEVRADFIRPATMTAIPDVEAAFAESARQPVASPPLDDRVGEDSRVVILVSDLTRSKGAETLLPVCVQYLRSIGVPAGSIRVLVARGTHRKMTREEKEFFKIRALSGVRVEEHNCDNPDKVSALLLTHHGTPVRVNRALRESDAIILLAPVSFHYFAGFGGGRKLILPGAADRAAILANHRLSLVNSKPVRLHPRCRAGITDGNPVHEDMIETLEALPAVFGINFFGDSEGNVVHLNMGDPILAHAEACEVYRAIHERNVPEPHRVLILGTGGMPYDINFLQSHKALRHAADAVRKGGTILFCAECREGVGSKSLENALAVPRDEFLDRAYDEYDLNNQTAVSLHDLTAKFEVGMVSAMNVDVLLSCGIKPCVNAEAFLAEALEKHGADAVGVIPEGSMVLANNSGGSM